MYKFVCLVTLVVLSSYVNGIDYGELVRLSKSKVQLEDQFFRCKMNDTVTVTAPNLYSADVLYYLTKPNNDVFLINFVYGEKNFEFDLGPFEEEDNGNWVLTLFIKDIDYNWIEMYKVLTVSLYDTRKLKAEKLYLKTGEALKISFSQPMKDIYSCELIHPNSFDRYYKRTDLEDCTYIIPNVTAKDTGLWNIRGVGNIVHEGEIYVEVR